MRVSGREPSPAGRGPYGGYGNGNGYGNGYGYGGRDRDRDRDDDRNGSKGYRSRGHSPPMSPNSAKTTLSFKQQDAVSHILQILDDSRLNGPDKVQVIKHVSDRLSSR